MVKDSNINYSLLNRNPALKVKGSTPSLDKLVDFSNVPKIGEYLVIFKGFFIFGKHQISNVPIRTINRNVEFYDAS